MSAGSGGEPGREQDPWSQPADFGEPGSAAPPPPWPGQQNQTTGQQASQDGFPLSPSGSSTASAEPWAAPAGGYPPAAGPYQQPAGQYQQPAGQYQQPAGQYQQPARPYQQPAGPYQPSAGQYQPPAGPYQPPPGSYGYQQAPYYPAAAAARNNPVAIAALVCGIAQFFLGLLVVGNILLAIPAVICGAIGLRQVDQRGERGRGMAIAGLVLGILGVAYFLIVVLLIIIGLHARTT
ncbi:MAG: DUF4190 domain-containing protein [Streptosporangiaceae bacterium]